MSPVSPRSARSSGARRAASVALLVTPFGGMHSLECQRFLVEHGWLVQAGVLPGADEAVLLVIAPRLALGRLVFLAEVPATRLVARQRIETHQLGKLQIVGNAPGIFEGLVEVIAAARHGDVVPELLA